MASTQPQPQLHETEVVDTGPDGPGLLDAPAAPGLVARAGAEAFGTFGLVLALLGTGLYLQLSSVSAIGVALAGGLTLAGLIAALGPVSGGHFNPAVSLGAALSGRLPWLDMLAYWVAQVVGGVIAAAILFATVPKGLSEILVQRPDARASDLFGTVANGWGDHSPLFRQTEAFTTQQGLDSLTFDLRTALILEVIASAVFVAVTIGVVARRAAVAVGPFAVGLTLAAMLMVTGLATGGGLNPARSTAAAIFAGGDALGQLWLFWLAPLLGAAIVGLFAMAFAPAAPEPFMAEEYEEDLDDEDEDDEGEDDEVDEVERV